MAPDPATTVPPPLKNGYQTLARLSWLTLLLSTLANILLTPLVGTPPLPGMRYVIPVVSGLCMVVGVLSGLIALFGIPRYGRKGILWPALIGLSVWIGLSWASLSVISNLGRMAAMRPRAVLAPAVHKADARQVRDEEAGFTFDLPEGYEAISPTALPSKYQQGFLERMADEPARLLLVSHLNKPLSPVRLQAKDLPANLPGAALTALRWRGMEVDAFRVLEEKDGVRYVTLNVQLPLRQGGVQLGFGGSEASEPLLRAMAEQVLSTLDGETNW